MAAGCFIAFEGVDGSGKSTQARLCAERIAARGHEVVAVREPGSTPLSSAIREWVLDPARQIAPTTELLLYMAARAQLVAEVIAPALASGKVVIADRFGWSTLAYQGHGRGIDRATIDALMRVACAGIWPDFMVLLDIEPALRRERLQTQGRALDRLEREDEAFFTRVREGFLALAREPSTRSAVFSGSQPIATLTEDIMARIQPYLPTRP